MKSSIPKITVFLALLQVSATEPLFAQSPLTIAERFCRLDYEGQRYSRDESAEIFGLYEFEFEPGWDQHIIISGYALTPVDSSDTEYLVRVEYNVLGVIGGIGWYPIGSSLSDEYWAAVVSDTLAITNTPNGWKLTHPILAPRVSPAAMLKELEWVKANHEWYEQWDPTLESLKQLIEEQGSRFIPPGSSELPKHPVNIYSSNKRMNLTHYVRRLRANRYTEYGIGGLHIDAAGAGMIS